MNVPNLDIIGHHPSYLPDNRGKHPIIWSRFLGIKNFGSSFFLMDDKIDNGKILHRRKISISKFDNSKKMLSKLFNSISSQVPYVYKNFYKLKKIGKKNNSGNYWRKRIISDGKIDFRMSATAINRLIRALDKPYPGAHVEIKGKIFKVFKSKILRKSKPNIIPGEITKRKKSSLLVKCYDNQIEIFNEKLVKFSKKQKYFF